MIDFACKRYSIEEILRCSLSLRRSEFRVFHYLLSARAPLSSQELSKKLSLDVTSVQRSLKSLHEKKVVVRSQRNLPSGGYVYLYSAASRGAIRSKVQSLLSEWQTQVFSELDSWCKR